MILERHDWFTQAGCSFAFPLRQSPPLEKELTEAGDPEKWNGNPQPHGRGILDRSP